MVFLPGAKGDGCPLDFRSLRFGGNHHLCFAHILVKNMLVAWICRKLSRPLEHCQWILLSKLDLILEARFGTVAKEWVGWCLEDMLLKTVERLEEMKEIWLSGYALIRSMYTLYLVVVKAPRLHRITGFCMKSYTYIYANNGLNWTCSCVHINVF